MPDYSCYYRGHGTQPVLVERYIDDIKNLSVGDYLTTGHSFNDYGEGMTKVYTITKITNLFVYIDKFCEYTNENQEIRLTWEEEDRRFQITSLAKGWLKNKKYNARFYTYVKKDEMNLEGFTQTDKLLRGCV